MVDNLLVNFEVLMDGSGFIYLFVFWLFFPHRQLRSECIYLEKMR